MRSYHDDLFLLEQCFGDFTPYSGMQCLYLDNLYPVRTYSGIDVGHGSWDIT